MIETFEVRRPRRGMFMRAGGLVALLVIILPIGLWWQTRPPADFPLNDAVVIPRGLSASQIADLLAERSAVRSDFLLYMILLWKYDPNTIQAGTYLFDRPLTVFEIADRITTIGATENLVAITLPEGYTSQEFALLAGASLPGLDVNAFATSARPHEGYLFPDTYYVPEDFSATELLELLQETYVQKTSDLQARLEAHPLGEYGVLTLASLLEREANTEESMRTVSGILQTRLQEGMRLQVDASMEYVLDRPLGTLKPEDLEVDSPYNTYLYDGLPPTPIGNPGRQAILAVLDPLPTDYWYYVTDREGNFYYARTFDEHRDNIAKYLQ